MKGEYRTELPFMCAEPDTFIQNGHALIPYVGWSPTLHDMSSEEGKGTHVIDADRAPAPRQLRLVGATPFVRVVRSSRASSTFSLLGIHMPMVMFLAYSESTHTVSLGLPLGRVPARRRAMRRATSSPARVCYSSSLPRISRSWPAPTFVRADCPPESSPNRRLVRRCVRLIQPERLPRSVVGFILYTLLYCMPYRIGAIVQHGPVLWY